MTNIDQLYESGLALHKQGQLEAAAERYDAALGLDDAYAPALHMRGVIYLQQRNSADAERLIRKAVDLAPDDAAAHGNLVVALLSLSRFDEAIEVARQAVRLNANSADIWGNLGTALMRRDRVREASEAFQRALALRPDRAGFHSALGRCLGELERFDEAVRHHEQAVSLAPAHAAYRHDMAMTLLAQGRKVEAEAALRPVMGQGGLTPEIRIAFADLLLGNGKVADGLKMLEEVAGEVGHSRLDKRLMFRRNYSDATTIEAQLQQAVQAAEGVAAGVTPFVNHSNEPDPSRRLRVGIVSADLRQHAVGLFLIETLRALDPRVVDLFAYSGTDQSDDPFNVQFRSYINNWRNTFGVNDKDLAARIHADRIDILIDLIGPTKGSRSAVFAMKPAPVAAVWLGYSGTTGMKAIDYIIGDGEVLPQGVEQATEAPVRLPDAYLCFCPQPEAPEVNETPAIRNGYVTFGSLNNTNKLSSAALDTWAVVLRAVPDSRLALKTRSFRGGADDRQRLVEEFVTRGISGDRIEVLDWAEGWLQHLPYYHRFDIGLDPFPYNGTTTTCESLHMGVPVLTVRGDRFISRVGASILHNAGLDEWIADDIASYVEKAVQFASDVPALSALRQRLRQQFVTSPVCDAPRFARNFEAALRGMWRRWCETQT